MYIRTYVYVHTYVKQRVGIHSNEKCRAVVNGFISCLLDWHSTHQTTKAAQ